MTPERDDSILNVDEEKFGKTPLTPKSTWGIFDSTKIQSFMGCPRNYFYSHILGWRKDSPNIHLGFGSGWHEAMEILQKEGMKGDTLLKAYNAFQDTFVKEMGLPPETLSEYHYAKNPGSALRALTEYAKKYKEDENPANTLFTEVAGSAPLPHGRVIHVKMDTIRRFPNYHQWGGKIYSLEHKTTGRRSQAWEDKWSYLFQVGTYDHALKCVWSPEEVFGVVINGTVFRKNGREFVRIPVQLSKEMWEMWVTEATHWIDQIVWNMKMLYETSASDRVMVAFPRNSASCSKFGCNHPELCTVHANPLRRCHQPPLGYKESFWDPRREDKKAEAIIKPGSAPDKAVIVANEPTDDDDSDASNWPSSPDLEL